MRIALDPVPLVLGIYAYVGSLLGQAAKEHQGGDPEALGKRYGRQRESAADKEVQKLSGVPGVAVAARSRTEADPAKTHGRPVLLSTDVRTFEPIVVRCFLKPS